MTTTTRPPATSSADRASPPTPAVRGVRLPQLAIGVLLTAGAALAFVLVNAASTERVAVLALADDVVRGQVIEPADLQVVHVGSDDALAVTPAERSDLVVGRAAIGELTAGTLVTVEQFAAGGTLTEGGGVVGLALSPGQYPSPRLGLGDLVNVVEVGEDHRVLFEAAEVVGVEPVGTQGQQFVSLLTGEAEAAEVAAAAAVGEVRLVLIARDGEGQP